MRRFFAFSAIGAGSLMLLLALFAAIGAATALGERMRHGSGLMFADVEILLMLALVLGIVGGALLWFGRRLARRPRPAGEP